MRFFEHFPEDKNCPICNRNDDKECWLMPIDGTGDENIVEATPVHAECTGKQMAGRMRHNKEHGIVYCFVS